ncbi:MAG: GyrI-like domain-containing protein [Hyphomonadaceae bacterium]
MQLMTVPGETWVFLTRQSGFSGKEINTAIQQAFEQLTEKIARAGIRTHGQPRAHFRYRDGEQVGVDIGFTIDPGDEEAARRAGLSAGETVAGEAMVHIHRGPFARLGETHHQMEQDIGRKGLKPGGDVWEVYLNDPDDCRAQDLLTQIVWPLEQVRAQAFAGDRQ